MGIYVVQGAQMNCSCGDGSASLKVTQKKVFIEHKPQATAKDHLSLVNIPSFGLCSSLANPAVAAATAANHGKLKKVKCIPNTVSPWVGARDNNYICEAQALLDSSTLRCAYCGVIKISDHGQ